MNNLTFSAARATFSISLFLKNSIEAFLAYIGSLNNSVTANKYFHPQFAHHSKIIFPEYNMFMTKILNIISNYITIKI